MKVFPIIKKKRPSPTDGLILVLHARSAAEGILMRPASNIHTETFEPFSLEAGKTHQKRIFGGYN